MKNSLILISCLLSLTIFSCGETDPNQQVDEGSVQGEIYTSKEIGWTIEIPKGWDVISKDKLDANTDKGMEIVEEIAGEVDYSGLKHLISFQKNQFNLFQSTSEPFEVEYEGEWNENKIAMKRLVHAAYTNQGMKIDTFSTTMFIDNIEFDLFKITIYDRADNVLLNQEMYSQLINGYDFAVNINYNNSDDKKIMVEALENSTFKKD